MYKHCTNNVQSCTSMCKRVTDIVLVHSQPKFGRTSTYKHVQTVYKQCTTVYKHVQTFHKYARYACTRLYVVCTKTNVVQTGCTLPVICLYIVCTCLYCTNNVQTCLYSVCTGGGGWHTFDFYMLVHCLYIVNKQLSTVQTYTNKKQTVYKRSHRLYTVCLVTTNTIQTWSLCTNSKQTVYKR